MVMQFFLSGVAGMGEGGVSKVHYGQCEDGEFEMKMQMKWLDYYGN